MIAMDNWATQAHEKLKKESKTVSGQKEKAMAGAVMEAIKVFCQQEPEFAQAVVQGQSFSDCMKKVAAGVGGSISDLDAYKKAVQFYFPGAEVHMQLTIDLVGEAAEEKERIATPACELVRNDSEKMEKPATMEPVSEMVKGKVLTLDLDDLFSF